MSDKYTESTGRSPLPARPLLPDSEYLIAIIRPKLHSVPDSEHTDRNNPPEAQFGTGFGTQ